MKLEPLLDGLSFGEGPRWHDGKLWFSDFYVHQVRTVDERGHAETIVEVPGQPSGLGWRPDGTMLIVSMTDRRLMRFADGKLSVEAELSRWRRATATTWWSTAGPRLCRQFRLRSARRRGASARPAWSASIPTARCTGGRRSAVSQRHGDHARRQDHGRGRDLRPSPDGVRHRPPTARSPTGASGRPSRAAIPTASASMPKAPSGSADPFGRRVMRVLEGGKVTASLDLAPRGAYACMLGGADRRTLFVVTNSASGPGTVRQARRPHRNHAGGCAGGGLAVGSGAGI